MSKRKKIRILLSISERRRKWRKQRDGTFASFAGEGVVVITRSSVAAYQTQFLLLSGYGTFLLLGIGKTVDRVAAAIDAARWRQILTTYNINNRWDEKTNK